MQSNHIFFIHTRVIRRWRGTEPYTKEKKKTQQTRIPKILFRSRVHFYFQCLLEYITKAFVYIIYTYDYQKKQCILISLIQILMWRFLLDGADFSAIYSGEQVNQIKITYLNAVK